MWKHLYDWIVERLAGLSWSEFLAQVMDNLDMAGPFRNLFRNDVYPLAGYLLIFGSLAGVLIYYFALNRKGAGGYFFKRRYWGYSLLFTALLVFVCTFLMALVKVQPYQVLHPLRFALALAAANLFYAAILFSLLSFLLKRFSVANTTPF